MRDVIRSECYRDISLTSHIVKELASESVSREAAPINHEGHSSLGARRPLRGGAAFGPGASGMLAFTHYMLSVFTNMD